MKKKKDKNLNVFLETTFKFPEKKRNETGQLI
jgi:hypothetical protein